MDLKKCKNCRRRTLREFDGHYRCMGKKTVDENGKSCFVRCIDMASDMCSQHYREIPPLPTELERFSMMVEDESARRDYHAVFSYLRKLYSEGYTTEFLVYAPIEEVFEELCQGKSMTRTHMIRHSIRVYREFVTGVYEI